MSFQIVTAADLLWDELGHQQAYYERPDLPFSDDDQIFRIRTKPGYLFDDYFWEVFQGFPSFLICHVAYYGPARPEDLPRPMQGVFELRWTTWGARRQMGGQVGMNESTQERAERAEENANGWMLRAERAEAERDGYAATLRRVLDAVAEHRSGPGPHATMPAGAVLAALFIDPERQKLTPEIERRARELQAQIDAERTTP